MLFKLKLKKQPVVKNDSDFINYLQTYLEKNNKYYVFSYSYNNNLIERVNTSPRDKYSFKHAFYIDMNNGNIYRHSSKKEIIGTMLDSNCWNELCNKLIKYF